MEPRIDIYMVKTLLEKIITEIDESKNKEEAKEKVLRILAVINDFAEKQLEKDLLLV